MRADVGVVFGRIDGSSRTDIEGCQCRHRLGGNAGERPTPPRVGHGVSPRRGHDDDRSAVGEAQKRRHVRHGHGHAVGAGGPGARHLLPCGSRIVVQGEHDIAVHLVERKQPSTPKARGVQEERTVLSHGHRVVFHMIAQIETVVRGLAHPALTAREAQAHACGRKQGLVG